MKSRTKLALVLILVLGAPTLWAQGPTQEKIYTLKVAFFTEQLSLSSDEAKRFWPIYDKHEKRMRGLRQRERRLLGGRMPMLDDMSDREAGELLETHLALQREKQDAHAAFLAELDGVISSKKIIRMIRAEEAFKRRLLQLSRRKGRP